MNYYQPGKEYDVERRIQLNRSRNTNGWIQWYENSILDIYIYITNWIANLDLTTAADLPQI